MFVMGNSITFTLNGNQRIANNIVYFRKIVIGI